eukprot:scaffold187_cov140-Skeletonema_marinoi.AAC.14
MYPWLQVELLSILQLTKNKQEDDCTACTAKIALLDMQYPIKTIACPTGLWVKLGRRCVNHQ